ncbi:MAG TPA: tannase/feruloyl esterase family alpha/beta hydrolase [Vicinamibacteria bacterium]|nr:tannase/feruloyl esterase family alpha/beta hydrolase [Vicinamibacteria bacterium]
MVRHVLAATTLAVFPAAAAPCQTGPAASDRCAGLASAELAGAKVMMASTVAAGSFTPPASLSPWMAGDPAFYKTLPAFCRVVARATPSADSEIPVEVWLPLEGWNGKLQGQGNGGFAGEIGFRGLAAAVKAGYASAATDTGHSGGGTDARWALGHPEKVVDFGYRAIHVMTQVAKAAILRYYGGAPRHAYFASCSNGGRQALMEAQRFPEDYDGILAGAPANFWTHLLTKALADAQATTADPASYIPPGKLPAIAGAVNAACDAQDGVKDGVVNDPPRCHFDPASLLCQGSESEACLTAPQVTALEELYTGPRDSRGREVFPGYLPGAELGEGGWTPWITGPAPGKSLMVAFASGYFGNMVYEMADWDYRHADVAQALTAAEQRTARTMDAVDSNLEAFQARGGKLIVYHGWNDPAISALNSVHYVDAVVSTLGRAKADGFLRLYLVPGMQHCGDGPGATSFGQFGVSDAKDPGRNISLALERWVEQGQAPSAIVATRFVDNDPAKGAQRTRPLCPYPQVARYAGGNPDDAASFACGPQTP